MKTESTNLIPKSLINREVIGSLLVGWENGFGIFLSWGNE